MAHTLDPLRILTRALCVVFASAMAWGAGSGALAAAEPRVELVMVETPEELKGAINSRTAMIYITAGHGSSTGQPLSLEVIAEIAAAFRPRKRARITSGTVDIPTASAPRVRIARISAGVSKDGPEYQA